MSTYLLLSYSLSNFAFMRIRYWKIKKKKNVYGKDQRDFFFCKLKCVFLIKRYIPWIFGHIRFYDGVFSQHVFPTKY